MFFRAVFVWLAAWRLARRARWLGDQEYTERFAVLDRCLSLIRAMQRDFELAMSRGWLLRARLALAAWRRVQRVCDSLCGGAR